MANREHVRVVLKGDRELEQLREHLHGQRADLTSVDLSTTDLSQRRLSMINFDGANLSRAYLAGSELVDCHFQKANLERIQLIGAVVVRCDFDGADFRKANCRGATIVDSWLDSARFEADLVGAVIRSVSVVNTDSQGQKPGRRSGAKSICSRQWAWKGCLSSAKIGSGGHLECAAVVKPLRHTATFSEQL